MCYLGRIALPVNEYISRDVINDGTLGASAHHWDDVQNHGAAAAAPTASFPLFLYILYIILWTFYANRYTRFVCFIIRNSCWILLQFLQVYLTFIRDNQLGELGLVFKCYHEFSYIKVFYTMCSNDGHYRNHFY